MTLGELRKLIEGKPDSLAIEVAILTVTGELVMEPSKIFVGINVCCVESLCINCDARDSDAAIRIRSQEL